MFKLKYLPTRVVLVGSAVILLFAAKLYSISYLWFQIPMYLYFLIAGIASFIMCWEFYRKAICKFPTTEKKIAISFDDGPVLQTEKILDILKKHNIKAAFFCIGKQMEVNASIIQRIDREGHCVGLHSYSHTWSFPFYSEKKMLDEHQKTMSLLNSIIGKTTKMFRPPFGIVNPVVAKVSDKLGLTLVGWSIRSLDTVKSNPDAVVKRIIDKIAPGKIILLHDTTTGIEIVLEKVFNYAQENGYQFVEFNKVCEPKWYSY
ncbi:MAG: polysaccharide deacetylase family protein [Bacteroidales bacterium]|nr:polysaccharide deacetylase family protein [Bacteroidales bacterium]